MQIWVDADGCPKAIKDILFRVAERTGITTTLVANQYLQTPPSRYIKMVQVTFGYDVADNEIVKRLTMGDLVITGDIPLAYEVLGKGGYAINPRGERYTQETIKERLNMRDFMDTLRASGINTGGLATLNSRDIQAFANQLDAFLMQQQSGKARKA
ncbi:MAG: YaiI/YqxD family protein [Methylococcaceae bacterium]